MSPMLGRLADPVSPGMAVLNAAAEAMIESGYLHFASSLNVSEATVSQNLIRCYSPARGRQAGGLRVVVCVMKDY